MKTSTPLGQPLCTLFITLAGIVTCVFSAGAAQDSFDIDLKELRPAPARSTGAAKDAFDIELKELRPAPARRDTLPQHHRTTKPAAPVTALKHGRESSYTVRPGDNLFLILIRQYGLSNRAAEQLIPEVLQRNGIHEAQKLSVGQRLIIPLAAKARKSAKGSVETTLSTAAQPIIPIIPIIPITPIVPIAPSATVEQVPLTETVPEREFALEASAPCQLAQNVAKELGLLIPSLSAMTHLENVSVSYDGQKIIVACGLTPAEAYTHERLLTPHGIQLLVFNGEVSPRRVVEELADRLGIAFWLANEDASDELPVTYIFPAADPAEKGVRLTIRPVPPAKTP